MSDIFVVTSGEYSDYGISAVFDSRELAVKYLGFDPDKEENPISAYSKCYIEKYTLNCGHNQKGFIYEILMLFNGNTGYCHIDEDKDKLPLKRFTLQKEDQRDKKHMTLRIWVRAKDEKHAVKIANEKRVQLIAENKMR